MLVIRLFRVGKKNQPSYKIVVTDKRRPPRAGRFVEQVGFYNPISRAPKARKGEVNAKHSLSIKEKNLKSERIKYWLSVGAQPSDTVYNLLTSEKIIEGKKIDVHKKAKKKEEAEEKVTKEKSVPEKQAEEVPKKEETEEKVIKEKSVEEEPTEVT